MAGFDFAKIGGGDQLKFAETAMNFAFHLQGDMYSKAWFGDNQKPSQTLEQQQDTINQALLKNIFPEIT
jgi:hypothetical protein